MKDMKDMYRLTRFVYSEKYNPPAHLTSPKAAEEDCIKQYSQKRHLALFGKKVSMAHAKQVMRNAIEARYIEAVGDNTPAHSGHQMWVVTGDGMQLISTDWGFRRGLAEQTMQRYPQTVQRYELKYKARMVLIGAIIGAASTLVATSKVDWI